MNLQPVEMSPGENLDAKAYTLPFASNNLFCALVMSVRGAFENPGCTENDAKYLVASTQAAIAYTHPWALILDLRKLTYFGDDELRRLISVGSTGRGHEWLPTAIITSESSESGVRVLLQRHGFPTCVMQRHLSDALRLVERMHWNSSNRASSLNLSLRHKDRTQFDITCEDGSSKFA